MRKRAQRGTPKAARSSDSDMSALAAFSAGSDAVLRFLTGILLRQLDRLKN